MHSGTEAEGYPRTPRQKRAAVWRVQPASQRHVTIRFRSIALSDRACCQLGGPPALGSTLSDACAMPCLSSCVTSLGPYPSQITPGPRSTNTFPG